MMHIMRSDPFPPVQVDGICSVIRPKKSIHVKSKRRSTSSHFFPSVKNVPFQLAACRLLALPPDTLTPGSAGAGLALTILLYWSWLYYSTGAD